MAPATTVTEMEMASSHHSGRFRVECLSRKVGAWDVAIFSE
jgi:hypothetical protein